MAFPSRNKDSTKCTSLNNITILKNSHIDAIPPVLLVDNNKVYAVPLFLLKMLPSLFSDIFLLKVSVKNRHERKESSSLPAPHIQTHAHTHTHTHAHAHTHTCTYTHTHTHHPHTFNT